MNFLKINFTYYFLSRIGPSFQALLPVKIGFALLIHNDIPAVTQLLESVYRPQHFYVFHVDFRKVEWPDCHKFTELQKIWISPHQINSSPKLLAAGWKILNFWLLKQFFNKFTFVKQSGRSIERILSDSISYVWLKNDFPSLTMSSSYLKVNIRCQIVPLFIPIFHSQIRGHTI